MVDTTSARSDAFVPVHVVDYTFPADKEEAERLLLGLMADTAAIEVQLAIPGNAMRRADGTGYTPSEYQEWRRRALTAWRHKRDAQRALKVHVKGLRQSDSDAHNQRHRLVWALVNAYRDRDVPAVNAAMRALDEAWFPNGDVQPNPITGDI